MTSQHSYRYGNTGISGVRCYCTDTGKRIDVIRSECDNATAPLRYFWSSLLVNFITYRGAVCGFPKHTLSREGLVTDSELSSKAISARSKYEARGVRFTEVASWRSEPGAEDARTFSISAMSILDFYTVWPCTPHPLPISRTVLASVIKPPPHKGIRVRNALVFVQTVLSHHFDVAASAVEG